MRITSPKDIPLKNSQSKTSNRQSKISSANNQNTLKASEAFHSHQNSIYGGQIAEQYNLVKKELHRTETYISNKSGRSRSNHHGISMTRDKTIKMDNIYEPEHFGLTKNSQSYSTKSITATSNRNTKSISRLTRATSPTITSYPDRRQSSYTVNEKRISIEKPTQSLNQSFKQDIFDFKDLKKQIVQADPQKYSQIPNIQNNQDYYGRPTPQLTQNRQLLLKHKQLQTPNQPNLTSDYNLQNKFLHRNNPNPKGLVPSMGQKEPSINSETPQQLRQLDQSREKSESSFFSSCTNSQSHKFIGSERPTQIMKPYSPSPSSKLGWRDVIKK